MTVLGIAIVGCGQIVTHHVDALLKINNDNNKDDDTTTTFQVRALCDPSAERRRIIAEKVTGTTTTTTTTTTTPSSSSPKQYDTLNDLIQDSHTLQHSIDIIFIAVPHDLHKDIACQALDATNNTKKKKYVVLEKPLAVTPAHLEELLEASQRCGNRLIVAEQSPYWQEVQKAKELIHNQQAIGDTIVSAASFYYESMRDNVTSGSVDGNGLGWRGSLERAGGGIAMDGGLHWIRPLREILQRRIHKVVGVTRRNLAPELQMEGESVGHALFEMEDVSSSSTTTTTTTSSDPPGSGPLVATYSCVMLATAPMAHDACPYFRITGNQGELIIHGNGLFQQQPGAGGLRLYNDDFPTGKEMFPSDRRGGFFLGFQGLWHDIGRIVSQQDASAANESVLRAKDDVQVVLGLYKSAKSGQWENVTTTTTTSN